MKKVIKRGSRHACFHATMLTNMAISETSGDLRASQINSIFFQCSTLCHTEFNFLRLVIHLRPRKKCIQMPRIFLSFKGNIIWTCAVGSVTSPSV